MREEVEGLEDDPDPAAHAVDVHAGCRDLVPAQHDPSRIDRLEQVDAAEQRRLAGARGTDQAHDLVLLEREVDPTQHFELAEGLVEPFDEERRLVHAATPATCRRRRSRATIQSVNRASGIVIATKSVAATR